MLNYSVISDRLDRIRKSTNRLNKMAQLSLEQFLAAPDNFAVAEHHLRRAVEALLDVGRHILAKKGLARPTDYRTIIISLGQHGILPQEFSEKIKGMAGYRKRLVHGYADVSEKEIYEIITNHLDDFRQFTKYIVGYIEEERKR